VEPLPSMFALPIGRSGRYCQAVDATPTTFSTVFNFRDLGGLPGADGRIVHYGRLYRSDSLHRLTDEEGERLSALGVRTVLDLRRPAEIERDGRVPELPGIAYFNLHPAHREWQLGGYDEAAGTDRYLADRYLDMAAEGIDGFGAALRLISDADRAPLVMHCFAGKDRTGVLAALTLALLGVPQADIMADYAASEAAQAPIGAQVLRDASGAVVPPPPEHFLACPPQAMGLFLTELAERYGSVDGYARAAGVSELHIEAMRAHLLHY
jgi:protein-tyrosine phosphatase